MAASTGTRRRTLSRRVLGRALLERQLLTGRVDLPVVPAVERLVGLNAQSPNPPYLALWSRLERFTPDELTAAIQDRTLVRSTLLRATQHLVSVPDFRLVRQASWRWTASRPSDTDEPASLAVRPVRRLSAPDRHAIEADADRLLAVTNPNATRRRVRIG